MEHRAEGSKGEEGGGGMTKPTGPTGTAIREAAKLQRRVDELQATLEIVRSKCEKYREERDWWRNEFIKRTEGCNVAQKPF